MTSKGSSSKKEERKHLIVDNTQHTILLIIYFFYSFEKELHKRFQTSQNTLNILFFSFM